MVARVIVRAVHDWRKRMLIFTNGWSATPEIGRDGPLEIFRPWNWIMPINHIELVDLSKTRQFFSTHPER